MKSMWIAALAAAGCVLAVSPANALSITFNPNATMTTVPGAVLFDDFDSVPNNAASKAPRLQIVKAGGQIAPSKPNET